MIEHMVYMEEFLSDISQKVHTFLPNLNHSKLGKYVVILLQEINFNNGNRVCSDQKIP
jgi:hypothetical protein